LGTDTEWGRTGDDANHSLSTPSAGHLGIEDQM